MPTTGPGDDQAGESGEGGAGPITVDLPFGEAEVQLLHLLCDGLRTMIVHGENDASLVRLRPTAYRDAPDHEAAWQVLARSALDDARLEALAVVERTAEAGAVTANEVHAWLTTLNALRLVLGTQLDIRDDDDEPDWDGPDAERWAVYDWLGHALSWLLREVTRGPS